MSKRRRRVVLEDDHPISKINDNESDSLHVHRSRQKISKKNDDRHSTISPTPTVCHPQDAGHRYGNFHNYYSFHPPSDRLSVMTKEVNYIASNHKGNSFSYCDVGCNEGDLTVELTQALHDAFTTTMAEKPKDKIPPMSVTGIDIDAELIRRANDKFGAEKETSKPPTKCVGTKAGDHKGESTDVPTNAPTVRFIQGNVCIPMDLEQCIPEPVTLLSLFSITMWLHVHAGDEGFRDLVHKLCQKTKQFILIEPQESKSYRAAATRLRKQGRPPLDVSTERLKMRANMEKEIDSILQENGFQKICEPTTHDIPERTAPATSSLEGTTLARKCWNRPICLYERIKDGRDHTALNLEKTKNL